LSDHMITAIVSVLLAIIGVAALAVLLSRQSQTSQVLSAGQGAFSGALCTALSPITGSGSIAQTFLPGSFNPFGGCATSVHSTITFPGQG